MSTATDLVTIRAGITYRQLDHWVRKGWVEPRFRHRNGNPATDGRSGYVRDFTDHEAQVIVRMGRLTGAGVRAEIAAEAARSMVDTGKNWAVLGRGVIVTFEQMRGA